MSAGSTTEQQTSLSDGQSPRNDIGWIGTGVMGSAMAMHLLNGGHRLSVFNRTPEKTRLLHKAGANLCASAKEVATQSQFIFTMLGFPEEVQEVILGENGVLEAAPAGSILIDMTTSSPSLARLIEAEARKRGLFALDAPVSGGDTGARNATLSIMAGGDEGAFNQAVPLLNLLGKTIVYHGPAGSGQHAKMANQILIATTMIGVCESLLYAYKAGLNPFTLLQSVSGGAAASWSLTNYAPRILDKNFDPGFFVDHFVKDMGIALQESRAMKLSLPGLALAEQLYIALQAQGHGRLGTHSLILALSKLSSMDWPSLPAARQQG